MCVEPICSPSTKASEHLNKSFVYADVWITVNATYNTSKTQAFWITVDKMKGMCSSSTSGIKAAKLISGITNHMLHQYPGPHYCQVMELRAERTPNSISYHADATSQIGYAEMMKTIEALPPLES